MLERGCYVGETRARRTKSCGNFAIESDRAGIETDPDVLQNSANWINRVKSIETFDNDSTSRTHQSADERESHWSFHVRKFDVLLAIN